MPTLTPAQVLSRREGEGGGHQGQGDGGGDHVLFGVGGEPYRLRGPREGATLTGDRH